MTELEKMKHAKSYLEKLANGVDPITDTELPFDSALNNVRLSRCFFYVADVLRQVIENGGEVRRPRGASLLPFSVTHDDLARIRPSDNDLTVTKLCDLINEAVNNPEMKKLGYGAITNWLTERGFLSVVELNGSRAKRAGRNAASIGIREERRNGTQGEYTAVVYSPQAQQFVIDNLVEMVEASRAEAT